MNQEGIFQFGEFQVDATARTLRREQETVTLNRRAFDVLLYLVQNPGRVLTRDELLKNVWPDTFVDENSLAQSISALRRALEEKPGDNSYIATLPGRGYQFLLPVTVVVPEGLSIISGATVSAGNTPSGILLQRQTIRTSVITEEKEQLSLPASRRSWAILGMGALLLVIVTLAVAGYVTRLRSGRRLTAKDTVVLADFANSTGDPVFDDTLKTALSVALVQSPFLNVLSSNRVGLTLRMMTRTADTKLTPEVAREVCQRARSKAYIGGSIARLGSQYVLALEAVNCESGDTLVQEQTTAASKEKVLNALGEAASKLRSELGESLVTVQKFDVPLAGATTPSLEALKAYSLAANEKDPAAALPYAQRAIELDPNFAMAYLQMGVIYFTLDEPGRASEYFTKAFQLRDKASEWEKLTIAAEYYGHATGELDKAAQTVREEIETYPRATRAYDGLAVLYAQQGQYEKSAEAARSLLRLDPDDNFAYVNLANAGLALQHFDEARQIVQQAHTRRLDDYLLREALYALAFLSGDSSGMTEQQHWFAGQPAYANYGLGLASDTEAYAGHMSQARQLTRRAADSAVGADNKESAAVYQANAALQQAAYGNTLAGRQSAIEALRLAPASPGVAAEAALAFAMIGETARAELLVRDLGMRFPLDTQMQSLWLPAIQAQLALTRRNPALSLSALRDSSPVELGSMGFLNNLSCLPTVYVRGEAYLAAGKGTAAAAEFQRILDHSGIVWNCWTGALAHLGLARANALESRTSSGADADAARARALAAYGDFLSLWKDADPDLLVFKQAKAEYGKLQ
jgi:eukaryotic-like serine/threonine-protein kinase